MDTGYFNYVALMLFLLSVTTNLTASEADVTNVSYDCKETCSFTVTVIHADDGWDHFANRWELLTVDGEIVATRVLAHPHGKNNPFTRSLSNIKLSQNTKVVIVRAHDSMHGYGGKEIKIEIK